MHAPSYSAAFTSKPEAPLGPSLRHAVQERLDERTAPCSGPMTAVLSFQHQERVQSLIQVSEAAQRLAAERVAMQMARQRHAQAEEAYRAALEEEKTHRSNLGIYEPLPPPVLTTPLRLPVGTSAAHADPTSKAHQADAVGRAMADPSARAKAMPEEAAIPLPEAPADVEISSVGEDTDDDMACAAQKDRSSTEEPSSEVNGLGTRSLTASPSHERKPCRRSALRHRCSRKLRVEEKKAAAAEAAPEAGIERRACSRADAPAGGSSDSVGGASGEVASGTSSARQALQKLFQSMQKDKPKSGSSSESTSKLSETRKALSKLYDSMQKRSSSS